MMEQKSNKRKIGILTTFYNLDTAYSLVSVVLAQIKMLQKHGYEPVLFTLDNFDYRDETVLPMGVENRSVIPQLLLEPYGQGDLTNLKSDVEKAKKAMIKHMKDIDVCLTHDIIFINSYLPYNIALREAIDDKLGDVRWLHWMHSGPSLRPKLDGSPYDNLFTLPKNSRLVYMNHSDVVRAAEMYGIWEKDVRTIFNPMDIRDLYKFHQTSKELSDAYDLMSADVVCVYPLSTTRMDKNGKQLSKVIKMIAYLKQLGKSVRLVVCNAHANAKREKEAIQEMYDVAFNYGVERRELIFTSMFDPPRYELGVPHEVVRDMFTLGNLFIFPSVSENCPLVLLEAMAGKNILVLNGSFPAMKDFALENALYAKFGSLVDEPQHPYGEDLYLLEFAKLVNAEFNNNRVIKASTRLRQKFNIDYIFKQQLEPAIIELLKEKDGK